jgi:uncharacterized membrane protein
VYQSRPETLSPAQDDVWPEGSRSFDDINVEPTERGVSVVAGALLLLSGLRRGSLTLLFGGGVLLYRGVTGFCPIYRAIEVHAGTSLRDGLALEESITINKPVDQVYPLWRQLENLPRFMSHIESVTVTDANHSHWLAKMSAPFRLEWDAAIIDEQENKKLSWRSLSGSSIDHTGSVFFHSVPGRNGTEVKVILTYKPPAGSAGAAAAELLSRITKNQIRADLRAFKAVVETGEKPTGAMRSTTRLAQRTLDHDDTDRVRNPAKASR